MEMQPAPKREQHPYPHSKTRVIVNAIVVVLSAAFAFFLLAGDLVLLTTYCITAAIATVLIFFIKQNLASRISNSERREDTQEARGLSIKTFIIIFIGFVLILTLPLLSAGLVAAGLISAASWFIMIISATTGLGASEVIIYLKSRTG